MTYILLTNALHITTQYASIIHSITKPSPYINIYLGMTYICIIPIHHVQIYIYICKSRITRLIIAISYIFFSSHTRMHKYIIIASNLIPHKFPPFYLHGRMLLLLSQSMNFIIQLTSLQSHEV